MARQHAASTLAVALVVGVFASILTEVQSIGVCNGMLGDNLPSRANVVQFYQSQGISAMRIYAPDAETLRALDGTGIDLIMDVGNGDLAALASDPAAAATWVRNNVLAYPGVRVKYVAAGNEVDGGDTQSILPAMKNLNDALSAACRGDVKVSTAVKMSVLASSSPPSDGAFKDAYMTDVAQLLEATGAPLLANVYPYFAKMGDPDIDLSYALFQLTTTTVSDNGNGLTYTNLFDAMVDAMYTAMEKVGASGVPIVISESGWPLAGGVEATVGNAQTYNQNLINHVGYGTPKRPGPLETCIFAMFNENQKDGDETENNFGLFNGPDKSSVYPISFNKLKTDCMHIHVYIRIYYYDLSKLQNNYMASNIPDGYAWVTSTKPCMLMSTLVSMQDQNGKCVRFVKLLIFAPSKILGGEVFPLHGIISSSGVQM